MQEIVSRSAIALVEASRKANRDNDNLVLREMKALHSNTTFGDLPEHLQKAVIEVANSMFGYVNHNGYVLIPKETRK